MLTTIIFFFALLTTIVYVETSIIYFNYKSKDYIYGRNHYAILNTISSVSAIMLWSYLFYLLN